MGEKLRANLKERVRKVQELIMRVRYVIWSKDGSHSLVRTTSSAWLFALIKLK